MRHINPAPATHTVNESIRKQAVESQGISPIKNLRQQQKTDGPITKSEERITSLHFKMSFSSFQGEKSEKTEGKKKTTPKKA